MAWQEKCSQRRTTEEKKVHVSWSYPTKVYWTSGDDDGKQTFVTNTHTGEEDDDANFSFNFFNSSVLSKLKKKTRWNTFLTKGHINSFGEKHCRRRWIEYESKGETMEYYICNTTLGILYWEYYSCYSWRRRSSNPTSILAISLFYLLLFQRTHRQPRDTHHACMHTCNGEYILSRKSLSSLLWSPDFFTSSLCSVKTSFLFRLPCCVFFMLSSPFSFEDIKLASPLSFPSVFSISTLRCLDMTHTPS